MIRVLSTMLLLAIASCSPSMDFEGKTISSLEMRFQGKRTVDEPRMSSMMKSQPGTRYSAARLDQDISTLYHAGFVDDMKFHAEPDGETVRLIATVRTTPDLGPLRFAGHRSFSHERLARETGMEKRTPITPLSLDKARRRLERFYHRQGHPAAKVSIRHYPNPDGGAPLPEDYYFLIEEGEKR